MTTTLIPDAPHEAAKDQQVIAADHEPVPEPPQDTVAKIRANLETLPVHEIKSLLADVRRQIARLQDAKAVAAAMLPQTWGFPGSSHYGKTMTQFNELKKFELLAKEQLLKLKKLGREKGG